MKVVLAFSGGLDTSFCVAWLTRERGAEVTTVTVNTGGASRADLDAVAAQARAVGAVAHHEVDARDVVFDRFIATLIRGNVLRGGRCGGVGRRSTGRWRRSPEEGSDEREAAA